MSETRKDRGWMAERKDGNKTREPSERDLGCLFQLLRGLSLRAVFSVTDIIGKMTSG